MKKITRVSIVFILLFSVAWAGAQQITPFKKGDRVAFVGNSITDGGHYHSYIWLYYMTHFPQRKIAVFNAGIGGDAAGQIYNRWDEDVLSKKPTVITLTFGMNDTKYYEFLKPDADKIASQSIETCYQSYLKIEKRLLEFKGEKIMIASSPYDETVKLKNNFFPGKSRAMLKIADFQEQAAKKNHWGFIDFSRPMTAISVREQQKDSLFTLCGTDRIHPSNDGHMIMAYLFLKAQGLSGEKVADVCIDIPKNKVERAENCNDANSLPYPMDTVPRGWGATRKQSDALSLIPFTDEFNQELIQLKGIDTNQNYMLSIDGRNIAKWRGAQLAAGINLAEQVNTPQYEQALSVLHLNEERWEIERRLRMYSWLEFTILKPRGLLFKDDSQTLDTLKALAKTDVFVNGNMENYTRSRFKNVREAWQKEMDVLVDEIYAINVPKRHRVAVRPCD
jgi:lysophospholipase L1-like esterase